jgi:hypothetical protein
MDNVRILGSAIDDSGVVYRTCPHCGETKPLNDFGLRRMKNAGPNGEDVIRNQSWCRSCRFPKQ